MPIRLLRRHEAMAWVEYGNGTGDTYWANRRRANGHPEPYRVRYWGLGNEMYGDWQLGQRTTEDYVAASGYAPELHNNCTNWARKVNLFSGSWFPG